MAVTGFGPCNSDNLVNYVACDVIAAAGNRRCFDSAYGLLYANFVFGSTARRRGQRRTRGPRQRHVLRAYLLTPCTQT